jgi:D-beta-D-heptose 7-phosphate kinase/D-beta-D-heptose 1-phosphate adenosyltransferase
MKSRVVSLKQAISIRKRLGRRKKVVFTNGCFDIIHAGHVRFLAQARKLGDLLIVGLNRDASVRRLKGKGRPLMSFADRALLLANLLPVDLVVGFDDDTPINLIEKLRPDILVKGADYAPDEIVGARQVRSWGGKVRRLRLVKGKSTSKLIRRLRGV